LTREKVFENRLRRMAERQGFALRKSRRRDPLAIGFGRWWVVAPALGDQIVAGGETGFSLDDAEAWLTDPAGREE
jgi:hypothetical protein